MTKWSPIKFLAGAFALLLTGCATPLTMPYKEAQQEAIKAPKSVYLMTVKLDNSFKTDHQPNLLVAHVEKKDAVDKAGRLNFLMDVIGTEKSPDKEKGNTYFIRMTLEPGDYIIRGFTAMYQGFLINGSCFAPLHADLAVNPSDTYYLGHVDAIIRERKENEFKAGPSIPLIDQAVCGFSNGTFDITISDNSDKDIPLFKTKFLQLKDAEIKKAILPPFDRSKAQQFWEAH